MTKFEEKLEILPIKTIQHPVGDTKYYTAVHVKTLIAQADEEIANLKSKLQQQPLPVVPECVAEQIERIKTCNLNYATLGLFDSNYEGKPNYAKWIQDNINKFMIACSVGFTVEKPQLFYIDLPKVFGLSDSTSDSTFVSKAESGIISEFTKGKDYALKLTEQEIKSIDERYWQFAVPVEDGE